MDILRPLKLTPAASGYLDIIRSLAAGGHGWAQSSILFCRVQVHLAVYEHYSRQSDLFCDRLRPPSGDGLLRPERTVYFVFRTQELRARHLALGELCYRPGSSALFGFGSGAIVGGGLGLSGNPFFQ